MRSTAEYIQYVAPSPQKTSDLRERSALEEIKIYRWRATTTLDVSNISTNSWVGTGQRAALFEDNVIDNTEEVKWAWAILARRTFDELMWRLWVAWRHIRKWRAANVEIFPEHLESEYIVPTIMQETTKEEKYAKNLTLEVVSEKSTITSIVDPTSERNIESIHKLWVGFGIDPFYVNKDWEIVPNNMFKFMCGTLKIMPRFIKIEHAIYDTIIRSNDAIYWKFRKYLDYISKQWAEIIIYNWIKQNILIKQDTPQRTEDILGLIDSAYVTEKPFIKTNGEIAANELSIRFNWEIDKATWIQQIKDAWYTFMLLEKILKKAIERAEAWKKTSLSVYIKDVNNLQLMPVVWKAIKHLPTTTRNRICIWINGDNYGELDSVFFNQLELLKKSWLHVGIDNLGHIESTALLGKKILDWCMDPNKEISINMVRIHRRVTEGIIAWKLSDNDLRNLDNSLAMLKNQSWEKITVVFGWIKGTMDIDKIALRMVALGKSKKEVLYQWEKI